MTVGRTSVRPCVRPCVRPSVRASVRATVRPCVRPSVRESVHPSVRLSVRAFVCPSVRLSVHQTQRPRRRRMEKPWILPKFDVTVNAPQAYSVAVMGLKVESCAKCTYGQPVPGQALVEVCRDPFPYSLLHNLTRQCLTQTAKVNATGCASLTVDASVFFNTKFEDQTQDTFLVNVNVTEEGTEQKDGLRQCHQWFDHVDKVIPPRYLDDFYVDYTVPHQLLHSDEQPTNGATGSEPAATEGRPVLPRDQDDPAQPMRALPVDSRGDLLHSHSVSHKEINYLTDNLGDLKLPSSATLLTSSHPFSSYEPTQSQHKLSHQEYATYPQPGIRHIDRPRGYYNTDHRGHNYMSTDQRDRNQYPAAVEFMSQDYS
ncbi:pregnancy zone protein [Pimephales promelas]|nr:pregnancy zone protein [Pimephales promelas]